MSKLIVVESPHKAQTIQKYLPEDFVVLATKGHIRDLPENAAELPKELRDASWAELGVDVERDFEPHYVISEDSKAAIAALRDAAANASAIYLATDDDREGEAISWHVLQALEPTVPVERMVFHEITESAVRDALAAPRKLDDNLVSAQETRRILDRLVGYPLSGLLKEKVHPKLSTGRVQAVATRLLVERERERRRFVPADYWDLESVLAKDNQPFEARLRSVDGTRVATGGDFDRQTGELKEGADVCVLDEEDARELARGAQTKTWHVDSVEETIRPDAPDAPFITSTLQREAINRLGMTAKWAMDVAQKLYQEGHITYMRTDSTRLSEQAVSAARTAAGELFGPEFVADEPREYTSKARGAQEAHEAIRPTGERFAHPDELDLGDKERSLYTLIWKRTLASQMADAKKAHTRIDVSVDVDDHKLIFRATGQRLLFAGHKQIDAFDAAEPATAPVSEDHAFPELAQGETIGCEAVEARDHSTRPRARYTEASLVEKLEELGIGRPSTYASLLQKLTNDDRYALKSGRSLVPTWWAFAVIELLEEHFPQLVDYDFTARLEDQLDAIAAGQADKVDYLHELYRSYNGLAKRVERGMQTITKDDARTITLDDFAAHLKVSGYGPYATFEWNGNQHKADVPEHVTPDDLALSMLTKIAENRERCPYCLEEAGDAGESIWVNYASNGFFLSLTEPWSKDNDVTTASLPDDIDPDDLDPKLAREILSLPRVLGEHPSDGQPIEVGNSQYGPYVRHRQAEGKHEYYNPETLEEALGLTLEEAVVLLAAKQAQ